MGLSPSQTAWIIDGTMIDTGSNILSSVGGPRLPATKIASMRTTQPLMGKNQKQLGGIGSPIKTLGTFKFYFHFGGREYSVILIIMPGPTPLVISHKDLDNICLNYQIYHKTTDQRR